MTDRFDRARWASDDDTFRLFATDEQYQDYVNDDDDDDEEVRPVFYVHDTYLNKRYGPWEDEQEAWDWGREHVPFLHLEVTTDPRPNPEWSTR